MAEVSKVIYNGNTLIDLTSDTVTATDVASGKTFHAKDGTVQTGTNTYDADTSSATATAAEILKEKTAYVTGSEIIGTMTNNGAVSGTIATKAGKYTIPQGYHDGSGKVGISINEQNKIIPGNILAGVSILGVTGTVQPSSDVKIESSRSVTPKSTSQTITPSSGYNAMAQVVVGAIPYSESANSAGGTTVTIG